jgi:hypothetical protein
MSILVMSPVGVGAERKCGREEMERVCGKEGEIGQRMMGLSYGVVVQKLMIQVEGRKDNNSKGKKPGLCFWMKHDTHL